MCKQLWSLLAFSVFWLGAERTAFAVNLVTNGDFEGGTFSGSGDALPNGWFLGPPTPASLSKVNVDTATDPPTFLGPQSGTHYVRFQSPSTNGTRDCLEQDLATSAGQKYNVSFWVAITSTSNGNFLGLNPVWDESSNATSMANAFYTAPTNTGPVGYQQFSFVETASTNTTRIDFHAVDSNGSILLDNVVVSPVPEPSSLALLALGAVAASLSARRRRTY